MNAAKFMIMMSGRHVARFIKATAYPVSANPQNVSFSGASAGQLAVVMTTASSSAGIATPSGWTLAGTYSWALSYKTQVFYKVLSAGDISTGSVNFAAAAGDIIIAAFYAGAAVASVKSTQEATTSSVTIAGFTKNTGCKGILSIGVDNDPVGTPTPPGSMTARTAVSASSFFSARLADFAAPLSYVDGTNETWTGFRGSGPSRIAQLIELT